MLPDQNYDSHGCYSGSAFPVGEDLFLFYTGNRMVKEGEFEQTQCLAKMEKSYDVKKHGVIVERDKMTFTENFRDPVIFQRDNDYYMLVGAETIEKQGALALYKGETFDTFSYQGNVDIGIDNFGYMWECPNYYEQDEHSY